MTTQRGDLRACRFVLVIVILIVIMILLVLDPVDHEYVYDQEHECRRCAA